MSNSGRKLEKILIKKGYKSVDAKKANGRWSVIAFNPLKKNSVSFADIGSSYDKAKEILSSAEDVPHHYLCADSRACTDCGVFDRPIGYTFKNGDFIHKCQSCGFEWVASTAAEQEEAASTRMEEAREILNPVLRSFMHGRRT